MLTSSGRALKENMNQVEGITFKFIVSLISTYLRFRVRDAKMCFGTILD